MEICSISLFEWFQNNQMKVNLEKLLMNVSRPATIKIGKNTI